MMQRELFLVIAEDDRILLDAVAINMEMDNKIKIAKARSLGEAKKYLADYLRGGGKCSTAVLLDLELPDVGGVNGIKEILQFSPDTAVIAFTGYYDREEAALKAGATAFIGKGTEKAYGRELIHEIRTAVIKNDIRLCNRPKNEAIDAAIQTVTEAQSALSGEITMTQLDNFRKSRDPSSDTYKQKPTNHS